MRDIEKQKELERQFKKIQMNSHYGAYSSDHFIDFEEIERIKKKERRNKIIDELLCE